MLVIIDSFHDIPVLLIGSCGGAGVTLLKLELIKVDI